MAEGGIEHPASAPPSTTQLRYSDISRLQAKPDPRLARLITLAASKTGADQEQYDVSENAQYPGGDIPQGQPEMFQQSGPVEPLMSQGMQADYGAYQYPAPMPSAQSIPQMVYPQGDSYMHSAMLPVANLPSGPGQPAQTLEYSSSTRRRALLRSTTLGPGLPSSRPYDLQGSQPQISAPGGSSLAVRPSYPGPYGRPVSEGIIPNIASSLISQPSMNPQSGSPPRSLLDDIAAAVGPPAKKARFS